MLKLKFGYYQKFGRVRGSGSIVCRHKGGGKKRQYLYVDKHRLLFNVPGLVCKLYYNHFSNTKVGLVLYSNGMYSYVVLGSQTKVGDLILNMKDNRSTLFFADLLISNSDNVYLPIKLLPESSFISYLEEFPYRGAVYGRSYGSRIRIVRHITPRFSLIRLPSGQLKIFHSEARCLPTRAGKSTLFRPIIGSAGTSRNLGVRPTVRGVAMNPVDHPHGGGEGKTSGGRPSSSPWGWYTKGIKTKARNKYSSYRFIKKKKTVIKI